MNTAADFAYWDSHYEKRPDPLESVPWLTRVFDAYVRKGSECFEVGCYPGTYLLYLGRHFGLEVSGIDATPRVAQLPESLKAAGCRIGEIRQGDFLNFEPKRQYDLVCSFGFVEHFAEYADVLARHVPLVKPGGLLIVSCPHFRRLQYLLRLVLDRPGLRRHYLPAMNLCAWRRVLEGHGMQVVEQGYEKTFAFWINTPDTTPWKQHVAEALWRLGMRIEGWISKPNSFTSPYMFTVAIKPGPDIGQLTELRECG